MLEVQIVSRYTFDLFIGTTWKTVIWIHKFRCDLQKFWPHGWGLWVVGPLQFSVEAHACSCAFLREKGSPGYIFHRKTTLFLGKIAIYFLLCYASHYSIEVPGFLQICSSYHIGSKVMTIWFLLQYAKGTLNNHNTVRWLVKLIGTHQRGNQMVAT